MTDKVKKWVITSSLFAILAIYLFPVYWMIITSLKQPAAIAQEVTYIPWVDFQPVISAWNEVFFGSMNLASSLLDSFIVSASSSAIAVLIGAMAGYGLARFNYSFPTYILGHWRSQEISFWFLSLWMMPPITVAFSYLLLFENLHLIDTRIGLIIVYLTFNIPFSVWVMRSFFMEVAEELEESALVDGCSRIQAFLRISLPLVIPGLIVTFIFNFVFSWNEFLLTLILTFQEVKTVPQVISGQMITTGIKWWNMSAIALVSAAPGMIFAPFLGPFLVRGLAGALKG